MRMGRPSRTADSISPRVTPMSANMRSSSCASSRTALRRRCFAARPRAQRVPRRARTRSHCANARMVPRMQAWMTRLRLMRACCSHSKNENSGAQLWVWDIVRLRRGRARKIRALGRKWVKIKLLVAAGLRRSGQHMAGCLAATAIRGLKELWGFSGDFRINGARGQKILASRSRMPSQRELRREIPVKGGAALSAWGGLPPPAYRRHCFAYPPRASALVQGLLPVADERRQEIAQDRAGPGLDFPRHRHAGG